MAAFLATFTTPRGVTKQLRVTAHDLVSAKRDLRRRGILARSIVPLTASSSALAAKGKPGHRLQLDLGKVFEASPSVRDKALFANKLAVLIDSGVPIVRSLTLMANQQKKPLFRRSLEAISQNISQGESLSSAMRQWPKVFDRLSVAMIEAGETGGVLDETLKRLSILLEQNAKLQNQIKGALGVSGRRSGYRGGRVPRDDDLPDPHVRDDLRSARCRTPLVHPDDGWHQCVVALTVFDLFDRCPDSGGLVVAWLLQNPDWPPQG